jgi:tetratricopeptide (TPR) repeat protein/TolB-like protein
LRIFTLFLLLLLPVGAAAQARVPNLPIETLVVLPFENTSKAPGLEWISESFPEILGSRLAAPTLYVVSRADREYAFDRAGIPATVHLSRATLYLVAEQMDADYAVLGSYTFDGQTFTARAQLLDMKRPRLSPPLVESGPLLKLIDIQTALSWDLLRLIHPGRVPARSQFLAGARPIRLDAFENYIRGLIAVPPPQKIKHFREAIRLNPNYTLAILQLARTYFAERDYEQAASWFAQVPRTDPAGREAAFYLGLSAFYLGDFARSEEAFRFVASRLPLTEIYNNLGVVAGRRGQPAALDYFHKAVAADPSDPDYHFNLAVALYKSGDSGAAARQLRLALALRPSDAEAKSLLDSISQQAATPAAVRAVVGAAPVKVPLERIKRDYNETSYQQLALEIQNATERRLARTDPHTHAEFHVSRGRQYLQQGFTAEAEKDFREAVQLEPANAGAHLGLARVLEGSNPGGALVEAQTALYLHPNSAEALLLLARLDLKSNQRQAAQEYVDRALALEPNNAEGLALKKTLAERQ